MNTAPGFLMAITSSSCNQVQQDRHWLSYYKTSNPCNIHYQHIIKQETMHTDLSTFLSHAYSNINYTMYVDTKLNSAKDQSDKSGKNQSNIKSAVIIEEYLNINSTIMDRVSEYYKYDSLFYGYEFIQETATAKCEHSLNMLLEIHILIKDVLHNTFLSRINKMTSLPAKFCVSFTMFFATFCQNVGQDNADFERFLVHRFVIFYIMNYGF